MSHFGLYMLTGNFLDPGTFKGNAFFIIRALLYGALLLTCYLLETAMRQVSENVTLKDNARMTESQLAMQKEHYRQLMLDSETVKAMRHDLRHHLVIFRQFAESRDSGKMKEYVDDLSDGLAVGHDKAYCENHAVGAITAYYLGLAEGEGVFVEARLHIPEDTGRVPAMDLCVVMGNMLENAVEACQRMEHGEKFIRARSLIQGDYITLAVENSFDGLWNEKDGVYLSRKRDGAENPPCEGVGLSSVKTVCAKYDGRAVFEVDGNVWRSSAAVAMGNGGAEEETYSQH
jgi:sensor histidine kinase regulating citrate/malate metabolism